MEIFGDIFLPTITLDPESVFTAFTFCIYRGDKISTFLIACLGCYLILRRTNLFCICVDKSGSSARDSNAIVITSCKHLGSWEPMSLREKFLRTCPTVTCWMNSESSDFCLSGLRTEVHCEELFLLLPIPIFRRSGSRSLLHHISSVHSLEHRSFLIQKTDRHMGCKYAYYLLTRLQQLPALAFKHFACVFFFFFFFL